MRSDDTTSRQLANVFNISLACLQ